MAGAWANSTRAARLPRNWRQLRTRILQRDPTCRICHTNTAVEVDHIKPGDNHNPDNLQGLCVPCHQAKTTSERDAAQPRRARPPEPHPGTIN